MRLSLFSTALAAAAAPHVADAVAIRAAPAAPALPISAFNTTPIVPLSLEEAQNGGKMRLFATEPEAGFSIAATCANPRVRVEWDNMSNNDRQGFVNALQCLMGRAPSGQFPQARSRYEDLVALHQQLTPNVHLNEKFLLWHRYYLWTFEDILRSECGFTTPLPWFDETKYAGRFSQSSIFSSQWFGAVGLGGRCVTNGQFAGLTLNVGPGSGNQPHCLNRNGDASKTANTNSAMVNACNSRSDFADMASCAERGAHAWGHNGIGAVMQDTAASPGDPVFWLHHAFIDRNYRIWQNQNSARLGYINGRDKAGNPLTLDTGISVNGMRPSITIRDVLDTTNTRLCYRYNY